MAQVILYGGGARSSLWREIVADVLGRPASWTQTAETAGLGAAMLAGLGCGVFASLDEARSRMRTVMQQQRPTFRGGDLRCGVRILSPLRGATAGS